MVVGLISDTHGKLRPAVFDAFRGVDLILHAGDVGSLAIIDALETIAPVHAVLGNTDGWDLVPRVRELHELELEGSHVIVVHGHQLGSPTPAALRAAYPQADIIVYGHTHKQHIDRCGGSLVINPGAAGSARFNLKPTVARMTLVAGVEPAVEVLPLVQ
jgi:uncharacterized protein